MAAQNAALLNELMALRAAMEAAKTNIETAPATTETATTEQAAA